MGKVEEQRRHRDVAGIDGGEVGALRGAGAAPLERQPVVGIAPGVAALLDLQEAGVPPALHRDQGSCNRIGLPVGEIDVHDAGRHPLDRQQLADEARRVCQCRLPAHRLATLEAERLRQSDGADAEDGALEGTGDGAGVGDILGHVGAAVDAGEHELRRLLLQDVAHAHDDAVGGRAAHSEGALVDLAHAQGLVQRERVAGAGLVGLRRHHPERPRSGCGRSRAARAGRASRCRRRW